MYRCFARINQCFNRITTRCAITIYKHRILPLSDYDGFMLYSCNSSDRSVLQVTQNDALRVCYNVRLKDRVFPKNLHREANLLSLSQR